MQPHSIDQNEFKDLVRKKWSVSLSMTALMLVIYFGFILLLAFNKHVLAQKIGEHMTLGIPIGLAVILSACVMTGLYVRWANTSYDRSVKSILDHMKG
ncbi:Inner membrane protein YjcH [Fundidesulfovibrio magnetotacticus]|uniref:Inner membrane protein YjcH n=1 Tax=Fundidesulfovibrio magnetotacticus TaxID=2730080 RepID=A0A6V8LPX1_9BACT|nr:DUF485 domain-containing protein [Fundidesulfovibrio magnetotacticus]GFK93040.1 Inner membrane protein YjcH [Fundidesulfovibrio magnetotacticus]